MLKCTCDADNNSIFDCERHGYDRVVADREELAAALGLARATIMRLTVRHGPFSSTDGTLFVIDAALAKMGDK